MGPFDLTLNAGEVVGLAGLLGSGRTEVAKLIFGAIRADSGRVEIDGAPLAARSPGQSLRRGMAFCPEDRKAEGIFAELSVRENIVLGLQTKRGWLSRLSEAEQDRLAEEMIKTLGIATPDAGQTSWAALRGNQQKVVLARLLVSSPPANSCTPRRADAWHRRRRSRRGRDADPQSLLARARVAGGVIRAAMSLWQSAIGSRCCAIGRSSAKLAPVHHARKSHPDNCECTIVTSWSTLETEGTLYLRLRALIGHRAVWPILALALILIVDGIISPSFFAIRIVEGRAFGNLIDILYRAVPTGLVALGMAVVIGTRGSICPSVLSFQSAVRSLLGAFTQVTPILLSCFWPLQPDCCVGCGMGFWLQFSIFNRLLPR